MYHEECTLHGIYKFNIASLALLSESVFLLVCTSLSPCERRGLRVYNSTTSLCCHVRVRMRTYTKSESDDYEGVKVQRC